MAIARGEMSDAARQEKKAKAREHMAIARAGKSDAARQMAKARAEMSDSARKERNVKARKQMAKARAEMSDAARKEGNAEARKQKSKARAEMSEAARQAYNAKVRTIMARPENVRKARERRRKVTTQRSATVWSMESYRRPRHTMRCRVVIVQWLSTMFVHFWKQLKAPHLAY